MSSSYGKEVAKPGFEGELSNQSFCSLHVFALSLTMYQGVCMCVHMCFLKRTTPSSIHMCVDFLHNLYLFSDKNRIFLKDRFWVHRTRYNQVELSIYNSIMFSRIVADRKVIINNLFI